MQAYEKQAPEYPRSGNKKNLPTNNYYNSWEAHTTDS